MPADLKTVAGVWAESVAADLSGLLGGEVSVSGPAIEEGERDALLSSGAWVCSSCKSSNGDDAARDDAPGVFIVSPLRAALVLAAAQMGKSGDDFGDFESTPFEGDVLEGHRGAMDVCVGILGRVLEEEAELPSVQLGETSSFEAGECPDALPAGTYRRARFQLEIAGFPKESLDVLIANATAAEWFGQGTSSGGDSQEAGGSIALVDACPESRDAFAQLADELGCDVLTLDPAELGDHSFEELAETSSVILAWDLGGRSGLDLVEQLQTTEATANLRIALASEAPTPAMVNAARRWGARTVLFKPWDAAEIRSRLL